jgi:hypothetical protein
MDIDEDLDSTYYDTPKQEGQMTVDVAASPFQ